ncbi:uncharacterized protein KD926_008512 [Aspergillus affinis]|uniref:uncharacterized protein n=1 Tax=Aspergillus affinis TaxID=1070780 RepID=UPI0022FEE653|nr:uncharacterized protein KD926_008512 [Aspergillus affinis]KAI9040189.1 hypothetical protein KD926_008512 [Aspergillus affinis]
MPNAEQHKQDTIGIMSDTLPSTRINIPIPARTRRPINPSAANIFPAPFQSCLSPSEVSTGDDGIDSPIITTSFGILSEPADILHAVTETGPPTINFKGFKTFAIPSILTEADKTLLGSNMNTVSSLGWIVSLKSDRSLLTGWNAYETDTYPLGFNPATTPAPLTEALPTPEANIITSIPADGVSFNQKAGSPAYIKPLQAEDSSPAHSTSHTRRLSHPQPTTSTPTQAVEFSSKSWRNNAPIIKTHTKSLITPLPSGQEDGNYSGEPLKVATERRTVPTGIPTPTFVNEHGEGDLVLLPSNTPPPRSSNSAKTEGLNNPGSSTTRPARPMYDDRMTPESIHIVSESPVSTTGMCTTPDGPDQRPSTTTTASETPPRSVDNDSVFDQLRRAQPVSKQNLKISAGVSSAGTAIFILTFVLHRFVYRWVD